MNKVRVLGIGVATLDMYLDRGRMYPGGNEYNVACNAAYQGAEAGFLGVFADDVAGTLLEESLVKVGVDVSMCHHEKGSSGYSLVQLKEDGDRVFLFWNQKGVTDLYPISFTLEELDYVKSFDVTSLGKIADVSLDKIRMLKAEGVDLCYDFHASYDEEQVKAVAPYIRYGFFSAGHLSVEETRRYLKLAVDCGCKIAVGTKGGDPVHAYDGNRFYVQNTFPVEVKDALGAGDSYIGAFLVNYLKRSKAGELSEEDCIAQALEAAAKHSAGVVQIEGGIGIGYDLDPTKVAEIVHVEQEII